MKIFGVVGWKNAGKTGLMERLVTEISRRGFRVSSIKHAHHTFDVDQPGKDSYRHRAAGAIEVLLSSRKRWALMHESEDQAEPPLSDLLGRLMPVDIVLVEGFKRDSHQKIEVHRKENRNTLIATDDETVIALASDGPIAGIDRPVLDLNDTKAIADFVLEKTGLIQPNPSVETVPELAVKPLRDDCFALPEGVDWVPVDRALEQLRTRLHSTVGQTAVPVTGAVGRVLAGDQAALRSNPPGANSAVDGYGFAFASIGPGRQVLRLAKGRSAAGEPFPGALPQGQAVRILTGALIPDGVDTIVMQEDVTLGDGRIAFEGGIKPGANTRKAGEDIVKGETALSAGRRLTPPDLALLAAVGYGTLPVYDRLRVGVLSTGDEIVPAGQDCDRHKTYDANRPMLLGLAQTWGYDPVDLGHVTDDRNALRGCLNNAADQVDVILTSGGASAGEEDHVSALLNDEATLFSWRIALKPGRPLAFGLWQGVPIFGLPGNPVAAFVCSLIFARPSLSILAGAGWLAPLGFTRPAAFHKAKKPGRTEYLRARLNSQGEVEVFASEGSGRISGLSWADGLVELGEEARTIAPGDPVRYVPFSSFGL